MSAKFKTVLRDDGYNWLMFEGGGISIFLHRQAKAGSRLRPGQACAEQVQAR